MARIGQEPRMHIRDVHGAWHVDRVMVDCQACVAEKELARQIKGDRRGASVLCDEIRKTGQPRSCF
jgi:hypothetical protein